MDWITVLGAYGRTYSSQKAVQTDWDADKDFQIVGGRWHGSYLNRTDAAAQGVKVIVRYAQGAEVGGGKVMTVR